MSKHRFEQLRWPGLLTLSVTLLGILGAIASIQSGWGCWGTALSIALAFAVLVFAFLTLQCVLVRTERGVTLLGAIKSAGLTDVENRQDETIRSLPPVTFYSGTTHEVLITGVTGYRTFDQHIDTVHKLLDRGCHVYVIILHPDSQVVRSLTTRENKNIREEIRATLDIVRREALPSNPAFHMRFIDYRPPYTAVMADGDVAPTGSVPRDSGGRVRVQPAASFQSQHKGVVLQFVKRRDPPLGGFDYFAQDLRREWKEAMDDKDLLD